MVDTNLEEAFSKTAIDQVINLYSQQNFISTVWEKKILTENFPNLKQELLEGLSLKSILSGHYFPSEKFVVLKESIPVSLSELEVESRKNHVKNNGIAAKAILKYLEQGYSLKIRDFINGNQSFDYFLEKISTLFKRKISVNLYYTPANSICLLEHQDPYNLLVVQHSGKKIWNIKNKETGKYESVVLKENDVLYLPKGTFHHCSTEDSESLHLTFGFHEYTLGDILTDTFANVGKSGIATDKRLKPADGQFGMSEKDISKIQVLLMGSLKESLKNL